MPTHDFSKPICYMAVVVKGIAEAIYSSQPLHLLTVCQLCHLQNQYYSLHDRDKFFGAMANIHAHSTKWQGASQAYPAWTPSDMDQAMKWAILSAEQSSEATLTLLTLPEDKGSSYCKWALHPRVALLTQV